MALTDEMREELGKLAFNAGKAASPNPGLLFWGNVSGPTQMKYRLAAEAVWNKAVEHMKQFVPSSAYCYRCLEFPCSCGSRVVIRSSSDGTSAQQGE